MHACIADEARFLACSASVLYASDARDSLVPRSVRKTRSASVVLACLHLKSADVDVRILIDQLHFQWEG